MPAPSEFILSFDLHEVENQFSVLSRSYTEFGDTIASVTSTVKDDIHSISETLKDVNIAIGSISATLGIVFTQLKSNVFETSGFFADIAKYSKESADNIDKLGKVKIGGDRTSPGTVQSNLKDLGALPLPTFSAGMKGGDGESQQLLEASETAKQVADEALKVSKQAKQETEGMQGALQRALEGVKAYVDREKKSAAGAIGGLMSRGSMGVLGGGIAGGLLSLMVLGYAEENRLTQQAGEIKNVFEGISDDFYGKQSRKVQAWFSDFQERAQKFYGVSKGEVQGILSQLVGAGHKFDEFFGTVDKRLGEVGKNVAVLSLGIDKHFDRATGTSMQHMNEMVALYGKSLNEAADQYTRLSFAAQRSGIGVENFINSVMAGSQAMSQYGIDVKEVAHVMQTLQQSYQASGLDRHFAGTMAGQATRGMVQGVAGLSKELMLYVSQQMGGEFEGKKDWEAIQLFKEGWRRAISEEDSDFLVRVTWIVTDWAKSTIPGRGAQITALEDKWGFDNMTAQAMIDFSTKFEKGTQLEAISATEMKKLRNSMKTEGERMNEAEKRQSDLIIGLRDIGKGLIKILGGLVGNVIAGFRSVISLLQMRFSLTPEDEKQQRYNQILSAFQATSSSIDEGIEDVLRGWEHTKDVVGDFFGSTIPALRAAMDIDMGLQDWSVKELRKEMYDTFMTKDGAINFMRQWQYDYAQSWAQDIGKISPDAGWAIWKGAEMQKAIHNHEYSVRQVSLQAERTGQKADFTIPNKILGKAMQRIEERRVE